MEISDLLVRGWKTVIDHKMDFLWVPDFLNAHFTEDLDCQGSSAILGHGHVSRNNSNLSSMMDLRASIDEQNWSISLELCEDSGSMALRNEELTRIVEHNVAIPTWK